MTSAPPPLGSESATLTARLALLAAELIDQAGHPQLLERLGAGLAGLVSFRNFIVMYYEENCVAELVHTNLDPVGLRRQMQPYVAGLYLLDPFYLAAVGGQRGFRTLAEVAPADFLQSDFYRSYYHDVDVVDEAHFIVGLKSGQYVQVFVERERPAAAFSPSEKALFRDLSPLVASAVRRHWASRRTDSMETSGSMVPLGFGLRSVIAGLGGTVLTQREVDIIELSLKGHSSKSIAAQLSIGEGTVTNHKRNVYAKLAVNSQAQLFHLFLQALSRDTAGGRPAPLPAAPATARR